MALTSVTLRYNSNAFAPQPGGDLTTAMYEVTVDAGGNAYPAGGEPIDFSAEFAEAHSVVITPSFDPAGAGNPDASGAMLPAFERDTANTGRIRFFQSGESANNNFVELLVAAYPNAMQFSILVHGRPITDSF